MDPPPTLERAAQQLIHRLEGSVQRALRMANDLGLWVRPGLPSALLAAVAQRQSDIPVLLVHVPSGAEDAKWARRLATQLSLGLVERHVGAAERTTPGAFQDVARPPSDPAELRLAMKAARPFGPRLLVPTGAEALLAARETEVAALGDAAAPWRAAEADVATAAGVQLRYPYLDKGVVGWVGRLPREFKRGPDGAAPVLRAACERMGLPPKVLANGAPVAAPAQT